MCTIVWIRHAQKAYQNSKGPPGSYAHDPSIVENDIPNIISRSRQLKELFGSPNMCIASPYLRCRQTAATLFGEAKIDTNISEHLGYQKNRDLEPDVCQSTREAAPKGLPLVRETKDQLRSRVKQHLVNIRDCQGVCWIVTHGIIIDYIYEQLKDIVPNDIKCQPDLNTLGVMYLKDGKYLGIL